LSFLKSGSEEEEASIVQGDGRERERRTTVEIGLLKSNGVSARFLS